jgi:hypothetical protein
VQIAKNRNTLIMGFILLIFFRSGAPKMLVNAGPTAGIRRERLSATFGQVGMFVVDLGV